MTLRRRTIPKAVLAATAVLAVALLGLAAAPGRSEAGTSLVKTTSGRLEGLATKHAREFLGVRYAKPPVGKLRWAPPVPYRSDRRVSAKKPGPNCLQSNEKARRAASSPRTASSST